MSGKIPDGLVSFSDSLESFWSDWKVSGGSVKFPDNLESFLPLTVRKVCEYPENFLSILKVTRLFGKFLHCLENLALSGKFKDFLEGVRTDKKVFVHSGKLPDNIELFYQIMAILSK